MLSDVKRVVFILEIYDGFRLMHVKYFDYRRHALKAFQSTCDEGLHCTLYCRTVLGDFFPDDWNRYLHSPLSFDNPHWIKLDPPIYENRKDNEK